MNLANLNVLKRDL